MPWLSLALGFVGGLAALLIGGPIIAWLLVLYFEEQLDMASDATQRTKAPAPPSFPVRASYGSCGPAVSSPRNSYDQTVYDAYD